MERAGKRAGERVREQRCAVDIITDMLSYTSISARVLEKQGVAYHLLQLRGRIFTTLHSVASIESLTSIHTNIMHSAFQKGN